MLINQSVSEVLGTPAIKLNRGDVTSSGLELNLMQKYCDQNFSGMLTPFNQLLNQKLPI